MPPKSDFDPIRDLRLAFVLLSRLPLPHLPESAFLHSAQAVWAYPIVGAVVGGLATGAGWALAQLDLPVALAAGVTLGLLMLLSGAMHEDGLADSADGFWGGHDPAHRLEIMKDSHIGTYGVLALFIVTGLRWLAIAGLLATAPLAVICSAALSRGVMPGVMSALPHARAQGLSHSVGRPGPILAGLSVAVSTLIAIPLIGPMALILSLLAGLAALGIAVLANAKIGGQTGDVLGMTQQIADVALLCTAFALIA